MHFFLNIKERICLALDMNQLYLVNSSFQPMRNIVFKRWHSLHAHKWQFRTEHPIACPENLNMMLQFKTFLSVWADKWKNGM